MTRWQKFWVRFFLYLRYEFEEDLRNIWRRIWNKRLKLWWYRLFIRKNEFHPSLSTDLEAMLVMNENELSRYYEDLGRRRFIAHRRALAREDRALGL